MVSLDVTQGVFRNGYLARGVWAERRELLRSAQISWLKNVACSSHELASTQPDLLQKWLENPQTTTDLEVFRLQSQRLFRFSKCWRSLRMTENLSRCTAHISILYTSIGCSLRSLKCKWFLHKRTSTILMRSPCCFLQVVFAWRWKFQRWTTWLCDLTLLSPRRKQLCSLCTTMSSFFFCSDQWRVTEGEGCFHPDGRWFKAKGGNEFTGEEEWN